VEEVGYDEAGVVVSAVGARCGKTFLAEPPWTAIANTHALVPDDEINVRFLWHLTNREDWWIKSGTAQPFVKVKDTLERPTLIPSLPEQERIVEILEEQLSRLDASLAVADAVEERSAALRRSLLHSAFTGRLTRGWREAVNV
ncbi:MAG: restriction endonuclease subunit S, partial [Pirellulaceae bacterium]|nr:restriction endonuclease subunit S [Pirellulaceae bacterium]